MWVEGCCKIRKGQPPHSWRVAAVDGLLDNQNAKVGKYSKLDRILDLINLYGIDFAKLLHGQNTVKESYHSSAHTSSLPMLYNGSIRPVLANGNTSAISSRRLAHYRSSRGDDRSRAVTGNPFWILSNPPRTWSGQPITVTLSEVRDYIERSSNYADGTGACAR